MRIVSGKFKGRKINPPSSIKARPTTDMAREGLFNVLQNRIDLEGIEVLDLFCGTGAVSLEFLSRGAKSATAVDIEFASKKFITSLLKSWEIQNMRVVRANVFALVKKANKAFDIVFADPPYALENFEEIPELVMNAGWVKPNGLFILEHGGEKNFEEVPGFDGLKKYGNVHFSFFLP